MFMRCRLQVSQNDPQYPQLGRWVQVDLQQAREVDVMSPARELVPLHATAWRYLKAQGEALAWYGSWKVGINSIVGNPSEAYSVGSSAPPEEKFWVYRPLHLMFEFVEFWKMTGGGEDFKIAVTLEHAWMSAQGIDPIEGPPDRTTGFGPRLGPEGTGRCDLGGQILRKGFRVFWHREQWYR